MSVGSAYTDELRAIAMRTGSTMLHAANVFIAANVAAQASYVGFGFLTSLAIGAAMLALGWLTMSYGDRA